MLQDSIFYAHTRQAENIVATLHGIVYIYTYADNAAGNTLALLSPHIRRGSIRLGYTAKISFPSPTPEAPRRLLTNPFFHPHVCRGVIRLGYTAKISFQSPTREVFGNLLSLLHWRPIARTLGRPSALPCLLLTSPSCRAWSSSIWQHSPHSSWLDPPSPWPSVPRPGAAEACSSRLGQSLAHRHLAWPVVAPVWHDTYGQQVLA